MILYDSFGNICDEDISPSEVRNEGRRMSIDEIMSYMGETDLEPAVLETRYRVDFFKTKEVTPDFSEPYDRTVGISFLINPADLEVCGISYFSVPSEMYMLSKYGKSNGLNDYEDHGIEMNGKAIFQPSLAEKEQFGEVWDVFCKAKEDFDIERYNGYAHARDMWIIDTNKSRSDSTFAYESWKSMRDDFEFCHYEKGAPYHILCQKDAESPKISIAVVGNRLAYGGVYFQSADSLLKAMDENGKVPYDHIHYGMDEKFEAYLLTNDSEILNDEERTDEYELEMAG